MVGTTLFSTNMILRKSPTTTSSSPALVCRVSSSSMLIEISLSCAEIMTASSLPVRLILGLAVQSGLIGVGVLLGSRDFEKSGAGLSSGCGETGLVSISAERDFGESGKRD